MRKEVILAIIIGLILGLIITLGVYTANKSAKTVSPSLSGSPAPTPSPTPSPLLTITSPEDGDIFALPTATISGSLSPATTLIVVSENNDYLVRPHPDGTFTQNIKLIGGANLIQLTAISDQGQRQDLYLNLVYTTALEND